MAGPRPLRAQRGPRVDVAVRGAAPVGLRHLARRPQAVPAVGLDHAGPPRARPRARHAGRRGDDRARSARASRTASASRWRSASCGSATARRCRTTARTRSAPTATSWRASRRRRRRSPASSGSGGMVYLYDDNSISLDGPTSLSFDSEDVTGRFEAYGWHVQTVDDVNDLDALRAAIKAAQDEEERPSLIRVKTIIGWPAPNKQGTSKAHGSPLGEDEVRAREGGARLGPGRALPRARRRLRGVQRRREGRRAARRVDRPLPRLARGGRGPRRRVGRRVDAAGRCPASRTPLPTSLGQGQARDARGGPEGHGRVREDRARRWSAAPRTSASRRRPSSPTRSSSPASTRAATSSSACASTAWAAR